MPIRTRRQEDFALLFMGELTKRHGERIVPISEVARNHGVSALFLKKLARLLRRAGLITSKEGVSGGYGLARDPHDISLWDILQATSETAYSIPKVLLKRKKCPVHPSCLPLAIKRTLTETMEYSFRSISLHDLVSGKSLYGKSTHAKH